MQVKSGCFVLGLFRTRGSPNLSLPVSNLGPKGKVEAPTKTHMPLVACSVGLLLRFSITTKAQRKQHERACVSSHLFSSSLYMTTSKLTVGACITDPPTGVAAAFSSTVPWLFALKRMTSLAM